MKKFIRQPYEGASGYIALTVFFLVYAATVALVIAPDQVKSTMDAASVWAFR